MSLAYRFSTITIIVQTSGSSLLTTRERAYRINHDLSVWLGGVWSLSANVVALDYFYSTNLIDMAIHINRHKSSQISDLVYFDMDRWDNFTFSAIVLSSYGKQLIIWISIKKMCKLFFNKSEMNKVNIKTQTRDFSAFLIRFKLVSGN